LLKIGLAASTFVLCFLTLEAGTRLYKGRPLFSLENYLYDGLGFLNLFGPVDPDPDLGWVPRPGFQTRPGNPPGSGELSVTVDRDGLRSNGLAPTASPGSRPVILALGDSFTYGYEVSDDETWPAYLERGLNIRVINAGVTGYGLDQAVLRAEALIPKFRPDVVILGFIPHDIVRCEMDVYNSAAKPYFDVAGGELILKNCPVPPPTKSRAAQLELDWAHRILGHSLFFHHMIARSSLNRWWYISHRDSIVHHQGQQVALLLMDRLAALSRKHHTEVILLAQYAHPDFPKSDEPTGAILDHARSVGLSVVDTKPVLLETFETNRSLFDSYFTQFTTHMTPEGNRLVAQQLIEFSKARESQRTP